MEIEKMENWDILTYLREERNWMVQSHYQRNDIAENFNKTFNEDK